MRSGRAADDGFSGFFRAVVTQDADALRAFFAPDAQICWHCSNERFTLEEYIRANCEYPGKWNGELERVEHAGDTDGASLHVVSFLREQGGRIVSLDEYYGDDGPAPAWRQEMKLGKKDQRRIALTRRRRFRRPQSKRRLTLFSVGGNPPARTSVSRLIFFLGL